MNNIPLPEKLRPKKLSEFVGQKHLMGSSGIIQKLVRAGKKSGYFPSIIFWGPPGCGKTTLARIIATELKREFYEFSAVNTSTKEIEKIIEKTRESNPPAQAENKESGRQSKQLTFKGRSLQGMKTKNLKPRTHNLSPIIFIDEIHRFNKAQQDKLLPYVEKGEIVLIGATTENPSFEVIGPLISRTRVIVLEQLTDRDLVTIVNRAKKYLKVNIDSKTRKFLTESSNGDARIALVVLEIAHQLSNSPALQLSDIENALQRRQLNFDKKGEEYYNVISAFIKSMRASNVDAALYYLARMVVAGQDPLYIARRMVVFASEDIGMAQPTALVVANEVFRACETIGYPECAINLAHGVTYLAKAKKDRSSYDAYFSTVADVKKHGNLPVPKNLRNPVTKLMKSEGYGEGYEMYTDENLLPDKLRGKRYYKNNHDQN